MDKLTFIFGVLLTAASAFVLGRYPNDYYYLWHNLVVNLLILYRIRYYLKIKLHYYLIDFCYFANVLITIFHYYRPSDERLFMMNFVHASGPLAVATGAFKNSLVFHSVDHLTSLAIHVIPMVSVWSLRWSTLTEKDN